MFLGLSFKWELRFLYYRMIGIVKRVEKIMVVDFNFLGIFEFLDVRFVIR